MAGLFDLKLDLLKKEMDNIQGHIRAYGQVQFTIKGWAITIYSGFIFFAVKEKEPVFLGLCAITVLLFWLLDAIFKSIQKVYIDRAIKIESFLQELPVTKGKQAFKDFPVPNTESRFEQLTPWEKVEGALSAAFTFQLALLYIVMLAVTGYLIVK